jgi:predicted tellurium resistance membrane protein TerC
MDFSWLSSPEAWISLLTLTILEIVLGIDNIIFISILSGKLPEAQRAKARQIGLAVALVSRILLLLSISWVMSLTKPIFNLGTNEITGRDLVLLLGGLFLVWKAVKEIHHKLEGAEDSAGNKVVASFAAVIVQIAILDIVFSLDSVITAVGMAKHIEVMIIAVVISVGVMLAFAGTISGFVEKHPAVKMLALAFLVLIGVNLIAEGMGQHIPKAYTYFAMGFAVVVEMLNIKMSKKGVKPVELRNVPHDQQPSA